MDIEAVLALAIAITCFVAANWYHERVRRVPLEVFGLDAVNRVLSWEPDSKRRLILARGWMTSHEWAEMNQRQLLAIESQLKRRGSDVEAEQQP